METKQTNEERSQCCGDPKAFYDTNKDGTWNYVCVGCGLPFIPADREEGKCGKLIRVFGGGTTPCPNKLPCPMGYHSGEPSPQSEDSKINCQPNCKHAWVNCESPDKIEYIYCPMCHKVMMPEITISTRPIDPKEWEEAIEKLAMAITHSEQGEYAKNEVFVREIISSLLSKTIQKERDRALNFIKRMDTIKDPICRVGYDDAKTEIIRLLTWSSDGSNRENGNYK